MTSRERVWAAVNHREPDRVPIDLGGSIVTGINAMAYGTLRDRLGLNGAPVRVSNIILLLAEVEPRLLERWQVDVLPVPRYYAGPAAPLSGRWVSHPLPDGRPALFPEGFSPAVREDGTWELRENGTVMHTLSPGSGSFVPAHFPLAGADLEAIEAYPLRRIGDEELEFLQRTARRLHEETDKALFGWFNGSIFEQSQFLCGWDEFLMNLYGAPELAEALLEKLTRWVIADLELYLQAVGPYLQVIGFGDDLGIQGGLQVAPEVFRRHVKPRLARIYAAVHAASPARVFLHSCGSVHDLIDDLIEIGVDILNPVQTAAARMEPERLKGEFGARIAFWGGGAEVQGVLSRGSPGEVRRDVRRRLEVFGRGGGYVFAPIHNLQADIPPENITAMYEEALRSG
jgi:uroporphyrinogen decarboxylase